MSNIIEITDFNAPELDVYARISEIQLLNRAEPEKGIFIAESPKVIERALDSGCQPISFLVEHKHVEGCYRGLFLDCDAKVRLIFESPNFSAKKMRFFSKKIRFALFYCFFCSKNALFSLFLPPHLKQNFYVRKK